MMSHETATFPLMQALGFLQNQVIKATISQKGVVRPTIYDYIFRSNDPFYEQMHYWKFISTQEFCKTRNSTDQKRNSENESEDETDAEVDVSRARSIHNFLPGHPQADSSGHRNRTRKAWPKYSGRRLPDIDDLLDSSDILEKEKDEKRRYYAQGILVMFVPFRQLSDLLMEDETWWEAYLRQEESLFEDPDKV